MSPSVGFPFATLAPWRLGENGRLDERNHFSPRRKVAPLNSQRSSVCPSTIQCRTD